MSISRSNPRKPPQKPNGAGSKKSKRTGTFQTFVNENAENEADERVVEATEDSSTVVVLGGIRGHLLPDAGVLLETNIALVGGETSILIFLPPAAVAD